MQMLETLEAVHTSNLYKIKNNIKIYDRVLYHYVDKHKQWA